MYLCPQDAISLSGIFNKSQVSQVSRIVIVFVFVAGIVVVLVLHPATKGGKDSIKIKVFESVKFRKRGLLKGDEERVKS